jgi:hypothetical protein
VSLSAAGLFRFVCIRRRSPRRNLSIDTLIVVETAVREAGDRSFNMMLVGNGCAAKSGKHRRFALEILNGV